MSISAQCPACQKRFSAPDQYAGKKVACPACKAPLQVPVPTAEVSGLVDLLNDELSSTPALPPAVAAKLKANAAAAKAPAAAPSGLGAAPPPRKSRARSSRGGFVGFLLDHKLVIGAFVMGLGIFVANFLFWNSWQIAVAACFGMVFAAGAWRSQWIDEEGDYSSREAWEYIELWIGGAILLAVGGYVTYHFGVFVYRFIMFWKEFGFNKNMPLAFGEVFLYWAVIVGYCGGMFALSKRFGFFKTASWNFLVWCGLMPAISLAAEYSVLPAGWWGGRQVAQNENDVPQNLPDAPPRRTTIPPPQNTVITGPSTTITRPSQIEKPKRPPEKWNASANPPAEPPPAISTRPPAIPLARGKVLTTAHVSPFVALGDPTYNGAGTRWRVFDLRTPKQVGKIDEALNFDDRQTTLSADGQLIAGRASGGSGVEVWSVATGKLLARVPVEGQFNSEFYSELLPGPKLLIANRGQDGMSCQIWTLGETPTATTVKLPADFDFSGTGAISPGGKYAALGGNGIFLIDVEAAKLCGEVPLPKPQFGSAPEVQALCFAADGAQLVAVVRELPNVWLGAWNMADGAEMLKLPLDNNPTRWFSSGSGRSLVALPKGDAWLLGNSVVIDRRSQGHAWEIKFGEAEPGRAFHRGLKVVGLGDNDRLLIAGNEHFTTWPLPREADGALKLASIEIPLTDLPEAMRTDPFRPNVPRPGEVVAGVNAAVEAVRRYRTETLIDAIAGDDAQLLERLRWFATGKRPVFGLRWGLGVQVAAQKEITPLPTVKELQNVTGAIGPGFMLEVSDRLDKGKFGEWPPTGEARHRTVQLLGMGTRIDLMALSKQLGLDAVLLIELTQQTVGLSKRPDTVMRIHVQEIGGETKWSSGTLSSTQVQAAQAKGNDVVAPFAKAVLKQIDDTYTLADMPELTAEVARRRATSLATTKPDDPLTALGEVRWYVAKKLLTAEEAKPVYAALANPAVAEALSDGDVAKRKEALEQWAGIGK